MSMHLQREMNSLKRIILTLSGLVEDAVQKAVVSIETRDAGMAAEVLQGDQRIDQVEVRVEEECLKLLALHQPVAGDLRLIIAVLKINNDLERIGDLASNIARRSLFLSERAPLRAPFNLKELCRRTTVMLRMSLDALMHRDTETARKVLSMDDEVDEINRQMYARVREAIQREPGDTDVLLSYLSASRHLERIADYTTNIAEDVIYMIEGQIIRHGPNTGNEPGSGEGERAQAGEGEKPEAREGERSETGEGGRPAARDGEAPEAGDGKGPEPRE